VIGVFAAMQSEVEACPPWLRSSGQRQVGRFTVFQGDAGFICRTGIGPIAEEATRLAVDELSPEVVLSVGTCGGLNDQLSSGDIILCSHLHEWPASPAEEPRAVTADEILLSTALKTAEAARIPARKGSSVSVDTPAWGPKEKAALRRWMNHDIVEMESYWIGRAAAEKGLPYLAIRVITDGHDDSIPEIPGLVDEDGNVDQAKLLEYSRAHPEVVPLLAEIHQRGTRSRENLSKLLDAFIPAITGGSA
jgi:adenosylhomocysteine nucleosidase